MEGKSATFLGYNEKIALDNFTYAFFRIDKDNNLIYANNSFVKLLEYQNLPDLVSDFSHNPMLQNCINFNRFSKNESNENEFTWITKNKTKKILKELFSKVKINGAVTFIDCFLEDITEKKFIEKLIKDINSNEASILKAIPDFIFVVSNKFEIIDCKNNISKFFPNFVSLRGLNIRDVFNDKISTDFENLITKVLETGEQINYEYETTDLFVSSFFEARVVQRNFEEVIIILRDISREKNAEAQLRKFTEELKQLNVTKDKFFSIIAHDLRTPLNGILNYAEILSNEYDELSKKEVKEFSDYILEISRSTITLLNNLLEWSRIQNGRINFEPGMNNLYKTAEKVLDMLKIVASHKGVKILNKINENLELVFDKNMINSILLNLINNAIKFSNSGGIIELFTKEYDNYYTISVKDEGVGMSEEMASKIFNTDVTISTLGTSKEKGTGIGLVLCKEFVKYHKGKIWVESKLGKGSIFNFTVSKELRV